uniref:Trichohyalin-plectin-homology domain-containing protein n=1 Tax=Strombidinopsis acuminata TaxID=141414 RepID=A0A7S3W4Y5_9SPIT
MEKDEVQTALTMASTTNSVGSTSEAYEEEDQSLTPTGTDIKRLQKVKAEQERRLKLLNARVDRLNAQERRVWKDVTSTQHMSLQEQENLWRRQAQEAERSRLEREQHMHRQALRERAQRIRARQLEGQDMQRMTKFEEKKHVAERGREESRRLAAMLEAGKEQDRQRKLMMAEARREQLRQQRLRKEQEEARRERARKDLCAQTFVALQEEMQHIEFEIAAAEHEELSAVSRLQHSQRVSVAATQLYHETSVSRR